MRTKTLFLAAALVAAGIASSQAQNVYSQNVVGYVNVPLPAGEFVFLNNPMTTGNDTISNVLQNLPGATIADVWNGSGFTLITYNGASHHWKQGATIVDNTPLPVGTAFFIQSPSATTNVTFVGSVVPNYGASISNALTTLITPIGSLVPYADVITNPASFNLGVGGGSTLQQWSVANQKFTLFTYNGAGHTWKIGAGVTNPVIAAAEGFFITPSYATNWVENFTN
jgi:hypothetical protein